MTQKTISSFVNKIYSKPPKKIFAPNKTNVYHFHDIFSLHMMDLKVSS